jgi:Ca-activated chloride channel homolog
MLRLGPVVALFALWGSAAHAFERARPMGLYPASNGPALAMLDSRIDVTVRGPIVETVVVQRFRNTSDRPTEATYIFPLPPDAAVSAMAMQIGALTIRAAIERRDDAQRRYEAAVAAGAAAALLDQERPDVFTQTVSAIPPRGIVEVTLRYDTVARYQAGTWELVLPMVVAPRYVPGTASGRATTGSGRSPDTDRAPDASRVTPAGAPGAGGATAIAIHFVDEPSELTSPTHELGGTRSDATLSDPRSDHDAIVRWRTPAPAAGWIERDGDGGVAAVVVEAPAAAPPRKTPLRVILAIDRAATTRGDADAIQRPLVRALFGALDRNDRVRVIGSDAFAWNAPEDNRKAVERAWAMPAAAFDLTRVLETAQPEGATIVLVSDGLVADDPAAIAAARRLGVPIHAIGIGPAPARATLSQLAAATGGTVRFAVAGDDIPALARAVLADAATALVPLTVTWGTLAAFEVEPAVLPRLGSGQAVLVLARVKRVQAANARARGELFAFEALAPARPLDGATTTHGPLARRWGRERLGDLLARKHDRNAVTSFALRYGLVSPYTSLVAIGSEVIVKGGVKHSVTVPVSVPAGMQWQAVKQAIELDTSRDAAPADVSALVSRKVLRKPAPEPTPPAAQPPPPPAQTRTPPSRKDSPIVKSPRPGAKTPRSPTPDTAKPGAAPEPAGPREQHEGDAEAGEHIIIEGRAPTISKSNTASAASVIDSEDSHAGEGESIRIAGTSRSSRALRLTAALGGGLALDNGNRGLVALDVRLETNRRTSVGGEASLWLVGGTDAEGRALLTVARSGLARWFELGFGAGLHFGNGAGIASSLRLRVDTPLLWLGGYLRYDAAVLLTRPSIEAVHAVTLGVELSY